METYESMKIEEIPDPQTVYLNFIIFPDFTPNLSEAVRILVQAYVTRKCKF